MHKIDLEEVAEKYNSLDEIWNEKDKWHSRTKAMIDAFISSVIINNSLSEYCKVLNAGSAGYNYGLRESITTHVDIAQNKISHLANSIVADIQDIPLNDAQFDLIICVGSVINYCDPIRVVAELNRLLKENGDLILEFESSYTLELLGTKDFNKKAALINTFYNGAPEKLWFFSEEYILQLCNLYKLHIIKIERCHILSPLVYRITKNESFASRFGALDRVLSFLPFIKRFGSNTILHIHKPIIC